MTLNIEFFSGHQRQGLRCRMCKTNVHVECVPQLGKCSVKAKLLRRQKSTSEIDNRVDVDEESKYITFFIFFFIQRKTILEKIPFLLYF